MTQMLLTITNHILQFSGSLLFHGEVYSGGREAVSDLPGKTVSFSSPHYHPLKAILYVYRLAPLPTMRPQE